MDVQKTKYEEFLPTPSARRATAISPKLASIGW